MERFCFHECDLITTPSIDLKKQLIDSYDLDANKILMTPNIVDTNHFKPIHGLSKDKKFLIQDFTKEIYRDASEVIGRQDDQIKIKQ